MLKRSPETEKALRKWWQDPLECIPEDENLLEIREVKMRRRGSREWLGYGRMQDHWLEQDPNPERCKLLISSLNGWAYDQLGFWLSVVSNPSFRRSFWQPNDVVHTIS